MFASHRPDCCTFVTRGGQHSPSLGPFLTVTGEAIFLRSRCPCSALQTNSCAVDELGAPGVCLSALHTEFHSKVVSFPGPTSYSSSTFYVPGLSFPFPTSSAIPESSIFNDALPQSPALPNYPILQARLRSHQASLQDPLPRALHKCPSFFLCVASPVPNPSL